MYRLRIVKGNDFRLLIFCMYTGHFLEYKEIFVNIRNLIVDKTRAHPSPPLTIKRFFKTLNPLRISLSFRKNGKRGYAKSGLMNFCHVCTYSILYILRYNASPV